jgi:hypothetical protein
MKAPVGRIKRPHSGRTIADTHDHASPLPTPPGLAAIAAGRDYILTEEFARATNRAPQTCRKNYCLTGSCFGVRPIRVGARLLWPVLQTAELLNGAASACDSASPRRRVRPTAAKVRAPNPRRTARGTAPQTA